MVQYRPSNMGTPFPRALQQLLHDGIQYAAEQGCTDETAFVQSLGGACMIKTSSIMFNLLFLSISQKRRWCELPTWRKGFEAEADSRLMISASTPTPVSLSPPPPEPALCR